jgi:hypothetical protein
VAAIFLRRSGIDHGGPLRATDEPYTQLNYTSLSKQLYRSSEEIAFTRFVVYAVDPLRGRPWPSVVKYAVDLSATVRGPPWSTDAVEHCTDLQIASVVSAVPD